MQETRSFTIDKNILYSIIQSQAGTLEKALLEGVQNSYDAGSTFCDILIDKTNFSIKDDGKGFANKAEIENFFERFGTPHTEGDGAKFGKFRMGRGQIFSYGDNSWQSGKFTMQVDIKNEGLDYKLAEVKTAIKGCEIDVVLYERLTNREMNDVVRNITRMVKYLEIPVSINGKVVSKDPSTLKWDIETDDAYIKVNEGGDLGVWHEGIYVRDYGGYHFGVSGEVVAKKQFQVNFARNDIMTTQCKMWKRISAKLKAFGKKKIVAKAKLSDYERQMIVDGIISGEYVFEGMKKVKLIIDTVGRGWELQKITKIADENWYDWGTRTALSVEDVAGSRIAESAHKKEAFILSKSTLDLWRVGSLQELMELFEKLDSESVNRLTTSFDGSRYDERGGFYTAITLLDMEDIKKQYNSGYIQLEDKELGSHQLAVLRSLRNEVNHIRYVFAKVGVIDSHMEERSIFGGKSDEAEAWTNGKDKVWIDTELLDAGARGFSEYMKVCAVLAHEYMHHENDAESHIHGTEFYAGFHEVMTSPWFYDYALKGFKSMIAECQRKKIRVFALVRDQEDVIDDYQHEVAVG